MSDDRLPKQLLYGELCYGKRSVGGQKKRFKDTLKKTLTSFNINVANWESMPRIHPCGAVWFRSEQEQQKQTGSRRLRKSVSKVSQRDFTLSPAHQPARHTHAPCVEECYRPELDWLATSAPTGSTKHWHNHHHRKSYRHHRKWWTNSNNKAAPLFTLWDNAIQWEKLASDIII